MFAARRRQFSWFLAFGLVAWSATAVAAVGTLADGAGVVTWGSNCCGEYNNSPAGTFAAVDAGVWHSVGLRSDGTVVTWGRSVNGQYNNSPTGAFAVIAAGDTHGVGLRGDGTVVTWGDNSLGQYNNLPTGRFAAIAAGYSHSLGLRTDGTVVTWGGNLAGQYDNSPTGTFGAIDAGAYHSVGLRTNGTVVTWGDNSLGQYNNSPTGTFAAVAAGLSHSVGLRGDGTVVTWGDSSLGQYDNSPTGQFAAVAARAHHSVGLRTDGTVVTWGNNEVGQYNNSPSGQFAAVAAGFSHSVGLRSDGTVVTWGDNGAGQYDNSPAGAFVAIAAGDYHSLGLRARTDYDQGVRVFGSGATANLNRSISVNGDMTIEAPLAFYNNATASVSGKVRVAAESPITGLGTLAAGGGLEILDANPASVSIAGALTLGSAANSLFRLAGPSPGSQYDRVNVAGQLTLGGMLTLSLVNGYRPAVGQSFDLFDGGPLNGSFASLSLPALPPGLAWDASQLATTGVVSVMVPEPTSLLLIVGLLAVPLRRPQKCPVAALARRGLGKGNCVDIAKSR